MSTSIIVLRVCMKSLGVSILRGAQTKRYLRHIFVGLCALALSCVQAYAQDKDTFSAEELKWIENNPTLKATNDVGWAPIDYIRAGRPAGFSVDYLKLWASKVGVSISKRMATARQRKKWRSGLGSSPKKIIFPCQVLIAIEAGNG